MKKSILALLALQICIVITISLLSEEAANLVRITAGIYAGPCLVWLIAGMFNYSVEHWEWARLLTLATIVVA